MNHAQKIALLSYEDGRYQNLKDVEEAWAANDPLFITILNILEAADDGATALLTAIAKIEHVAFSIENARRK
ncbi:hypothetical protein [Acidithiobacillus ferridurans]|jgi:hypothetical protein|uniref:Uncharacterized protein n=1 Tax=Acidithiobacillus ferridurans TaxID=1232575 RepID=A0A8X8G8R9_ACIFI|nr:hypothetical protein [Acidithiobacillus ferridurans]MBU2715600.1 hypothetical protein [Acidithiobacillus ferridurans]MBU2722910.1 hypothetical protein [Acidithiobacillus ferridurans]MBU2728198.1 hypothetical protein [Acidithiobacillus ferridurans]